MLPWDGGVHAPPDVDVLSRLEATSRDHAGRSTLQQCHGRARRPTCWQHCALTVPRAYPRCRLQASQLEQDLFEAQDKLVAKHSDAVEKAQALAQALKKGPREGNHRAKTASEAAQAKVKLLQTQVTRMQAKLDAAVADLRRVEEYTVEQWWKPMYHTCSRRNERLRAVTGDLALSTPPEEVDISALSVSDEPPCAPPLRRRV